MPVARFVPPCLAAVIALRCAAVSPVGGFARIDYDQTAWDGLAAQSGYPTPVLTLSAFFDGPAAESLGYDAILRDSWPVATYAGQAYVMNGATVTNVAHRTAQPTTFDYTPGGLPAHTGSVGLGGISRFAASGGGSLLFGDFTLQYDAARRTRGGSGWYLRGKVPPSAPAFDLMNPRLVESEHGFTLAADLGVSFEVANLLFATPADTLRDVGDFHFTGCLSTDPPAPVIERLETGPEGVVISGRGGMPGGFFSVRSSERLASGEWLEAGRGTFDVDGRFRITTAVGVSGERWFRVQSP